MLSEWRQPYPYGSCSSPFLLDPVSHLLDRFELLRQGLHHQATSLAPLVCFSETGSHVFKFTVQPRMILNSSCLHLELSAGNAGGLYMLDGVQGLLCMLLGHSTYQAIALVLFSKPFFWVMKLALKPLLH